MSAAAIDPTWAAFLDGDPSPPTLGRGRRPGVVRHELRAPVCCRRCERPTRVVMQRLEPLRLGDPLCSRCVLEEGADLAPRRKR